MNIVILSVLWMMVLFFMIGLMDPTIICDVFWDDDDGNNLNRCHDGESEFGLFLIMLILLLFAIPTTIQTYLDYTTR